MVDMLLPIALAFIMFSLGLTLTASDFLRVFRHPRALIAGLVGQILLVPLVGLVVALFWHLPADMAAGIMIIAACPGGASSGLITHLARGNTALSISLTAITSMASALTMPLVFNVTFPLIADLGPGGELPVGRMVSGVLLLTTLPVAAGMLFKHYRGDLTKRIASWTERLATTAFVLIVIGTFISQRHVIAEHIATLAPAALMQNLAVMVAGFALAVASGLALRDRIAIAIECGVHNTAIGIFVAVTVLGAPAMAVPGVIYALMMNLSAFALIAIMHQRTAEPVSSLRL